MKTILLRSWILVLALASAAGCGDDGKNGGDGAADATDGDGRDLAEDADVPRDDGEDVAVEDAPLDVPAEDIPAEEDAPVEREWRILLTAEDEGIFSLILFGGELFAGTYGQPYVYRRSGADWSRQDFDCESVYDFEAYDGALWHLTEQEGAVRRLEADGTWTLILDAPDPWVNGHALQAFDGSLFATVSYFGSDPPGGNWTRTYRIDGTAWELDYESESRCKNLVAHEGTLYAACYCRNCSPTYARLMRRNGPGSWEVIAELPEALAFEPAASFGGYVYLGAEIDGASSRIYRWSEGGGFEPALADAGVPAIYELAVIDGQLYASCGAEWRTQGDAVLLRSPDGTTWETVHVFTGEAEGWAVTGGGGDLYLGTRIQDGHGHVWGWLPVTP